MVLFHCLSMELTPLLYVFLERFHNMLNHRVEILGEISHLRSLKVWFGGVLAEDFGPSDDDQAVSLSDEGTTIIIDFFSSSFLLFFYRHHCSSRKGCRRVPKFCMGF